MYKVMSCALAALLATAASAQVAVSIAVNPPEIAPGESAKVEMTLSWPGAQDAFAVESWSGPEVGGAPLTAVADHSAVVQEAGKPAFRRQVTYVVQADQPGTISLAPARVVLKAQGGGTQEYKSQALGVIVRPGRAPIPMELVAGLVGIGLVGLVVKLMRGGPAPAPPARNRADRARDTAEALRAVGHRDHRQFFGAVVDALREGLAEQVPSVARDRDKSKIVQALQAAGVPEASWRAAEELVALCDEARFNPEPPAAQERERALGLLQTALS